MQNPILSICIPTYNRPKRIEKILDHIISSKIMEIEILISDDNPWNDKTQVLLEKYKDPRIKYFRNKKNLGYDANLLISIKRAISNYIFLLLDEDDIEMDSVYWIIKKIKENNNFTQIRGTLINITKRNNKFSYKLNNRIVKQGLKEITSFFSISIHASGIVLKKNALNLKEASKYNGFLFIQQVLVAQAMLQGNTLCTSKVFVYVQENEYKSDQPLKYGKNWCHPLNFLKVLQYRINVINDFTINLKDKKSIRNHFLEAQKDKILFFLHETLFYEGFNVRSSISYFFKALLIVMKMKRINLSLSFWLILMKRLISKFVLIMVIKISNRIKIR